MVRTMDNVAAVGESNAQYVEMKTITDGVMSLADRTSPHRHDPTPLTCRRRTSLMELRGRVALVTGGGRRLGQAMARALAGRGMTLAIHYHASAEGAMTCRPRSSRRAVRQPASRPISPTPMPREPFPNR